MRSAHPHRLMMLALLVASCVGPTLATAGPPPDPVETPARSAAPLRNDAAVTQPQIVSAHVLSIADVSIASPELAFRTVHVTGAIATTATTARTMTAAPDVHVWYAFQRTPPRAALRNSDAYAVDHMSVAVHALESLESTVRRIDAAPHRRLTRWPMPDTSPRVTWGPSPAGGR